MPWSDYHPDMTLSDQSKANLPNQLTVLRLVLSAAFFVLLSVTVARWALGVGIVLFVVAALTDALDGYLARKWKVESTFGRIVDPFADKVLVLGALIMLCGASLPGSGVVPWMVVVMLTRELLVTAIRGVVESAGHQFGANVWGKWKMILQSIVVPAILLILVFDPMPTGWLKHARDALVWATLLATVFSGVPYITGAMKVLKPVK